MIISLERLLFSPSIIQLNVIYWLKNVKHIAGGGAGGDSLICSAENEDWRWSRFGMGENGTTADIAIKKIKKLFLRRPS